MVVDVHQRVRDFAGNVFKDVATAAEFLFGSCAKTILMVANSTLPFAGRRLYSQ